MYIMADIRLNYKIIFFIETKTKFIKKKLKQKNLILIYMYICKMYNL